MGAWRSAVDTLKASLPLFDHVTEGAATSSRSPVPAVPLVAGAGLAILVFSYLACAAGFPCLLYFFPFLHSLSDLHESLGGELGPLVYLFLYALGCAALMHVRSRGNYRYAVVYRTAFPFLALTLAGIALLVAAGLVIATVVLGMATAAAALLAARGELDQGRISLRDKVEVAVHGLATGFLFLTIARANGFIGGPGWAVWSPVLLALGLASLLVAIGLIFRPPNKGAREIGYRVTAAMLAVPALLFLGMLWIMASMYT